MERKKKKLDTLISSLSGFITYITSLLDRMLGQATSEKCDLFHDQPMASLPLIWTQLLVQSSVVSVSEVVWLICHKDNRIKENQSLGFILH